MRNVILFFIQLLFLSASYCQSYVDSKGNSQLWGNLSITQLEESPYSEWYTTNYDKYSSTLLKEDGKALEDIHVKIFIGTWCGDTKSLLPKFIKAWDQMGLSEKQLELIAVHHEAELYKQGPNGETQGYNIHRVPTFIFEKGGKEVGRIVERTVFDLDTDLKMISNSQPYQHRYKAVSILSQALDTLVSDSLYSEEVLKKVEKSLVRELSLESELNTYAYVLLFSGEAEKAEFVFKLNRHLFKYDPYIMSLLGLILIILKQ